MSNAHSPFRNAWVFLKDYDSYVRETIPLPTYEELSDIHEHNIYPHELNYKRQLQTGQAGPKQESAYKIQELQRQQNKCLYCDRKASLNMGTDKQECWKCNSERKSRNEELAQNPPPQQNYLGLTEDEQSVYQGQY